MKQDIHIERSRQERNEHQMYPFKVPVNYFIMSLSVLAEYNTQCIQIILKAMF